MTLAEQALARIQPIFGRALSQQRIALFGADSGALLAEALIGSGVLNWDFWGSQPAAPDSLLVRLFGRLCAGKPAAEQLRQNLSTHYPPGMPWQLTVLQTPAELLQRPATQRPGLLLAAEAFLPQAHQLARALQIALLSFPEHIDEELSYRLAAQARALLLRDAQDVDPAYRADVAPGSWSAAGKAPQAASYQFQPDLPAVHTARVLVIGLGSLGSLLARSLAPLVAELILVDPAQVSIYNPVRQLYPFKRVGQPKALAAAEELTLRFGVRTHAEVQDLQTEEQVRQLLARYQPQAAFIGTGSFADHAIARALWAAAVPHLVGRCYPRARYWEAIFAEAPAGPCFGCLRGHLFTGSLPPPTPEQAAHYAPAALPGELQAEPATRLDSGWAAACMARLMLQLAVPPGLRERWLLELQQHGQNCLIGGLHAGAYGIEQPGQVRAYGLAQILGSAAHSICPDCGRRWETRFRAG